MRAPKILAAAAVFVVTAAPIALSGAGTPALADGGGTYVQHNLVSDIPGLAARTDSNLHNPWGQTSGPGLPIWVSANAAGVATVYDGEGNPQPDSLHPRVVTIPAAPSAGPGATGTPTGSAFNPTANGFVVSENGVSGASTFLFATQVTRIGPISKVGARARRGSSCSSRARTSMVLPGSRCNAT